MRCQHPSRSQAQMDRGGSTSEKFQLGLSCDGCEAEGRPCQQDLVIMSKRSGLLECGATSTNNLLAAAYPRSHTADRILCAKWLGLIVRFDFELGCWTPISIYGRAGMGNFSSSHRDSRSLAGRSEKCSILELTDHILRLCPTPQVEGCRPVTQA